jgi:hypothetical protein
MNNHRTTSGWRFAFAVIALENDWELKRFGIEGVRETSRGTIQFIYTAQVIGWWACRSMSPVVILLIASAALHFLLRRIS